MRTHQAQVNADRARVRPGKPTKDERLARIYHAAAMIIDSKGYEATSLNDVAKAVGLTKAGLYHYLQSKERLLFGIMNYAMDKVDARIIEPARSITDPEKRIRAVMAGYAWLILENGQRMSVIINELNGLTPAHHRKVSQRRRAFYDFVRDTIAELKQEGKVKGLDVTVGTLSIFGVMMWLAYWYRPNGRLSRQQVVEQIVELTVGRLLGLRSRKGKST